MRTWEENLGKFWCIYFRHFFFVCSRLKWLHPMIYQILELIQLAKNQLLQHSYETKFQANSWKQIHACWQYLFLIERLKSMVANSMSKGHTVTGGLFCSWVTHFPRGVRNSTDPTKPLALKYGMSQASPMTWNAHTHTKSISTGGCSVAHVVWGSHSQTLLILQKLWNIVHLTNNKTFKISV